MVNEILISLNEFILQVLKMLPKIVLAIIVFLFFVLTNNKIIKFLLKKINPIANDKVVYDIISRLFKWIYIILLPVQVFLL